LIGLSQVHSFAHKIRKYVIRLFERVSHTQSHTINKYENKLTKSKMIMILMALGA